jgi:hypothetical protein
MILIHQINDMNNDVDKYDHIILLAYNMPCYPKILSHY